MKAARALFACAAAPALLLAVLAALGARHDVGVVTTGVGPGALLGAAWVATWLLAIAVSPSLVVAGMLSALYDVMHRRALVAGGAKTGGRPA